MGSDIRTSTANRASQRWAIVALLIVLPPLLAALLLMGIAPAPARAAQGGDEPTAPRGPQQGSVITVGVGASLSGFPGIVEIGWHELNSVQLAISQTNAAGGVSVGGVTYTLALASVDSACDASRAITAANELLAQGAAVVVGHTCSGVSMNAQPIYQAQGVPMISPSSTLVQLTEQGVTTTFRTCVKDDASAKRLATHVYATGQATTAALVAWEGQEWIMDAFSTTFAALGGAVISAETVTTTESYTPVLAAIQAQGPDLVFYVDLSTDNAGLFTRVADAHSLPTVGWDSVYGGMETLDPYAAAAGAAAEGDYVGMSGRQPEDMPGYDGFSADYQAAGFANHGGSPGTFGPFAYDAVQIAIAAMESADSADPAAIRDAIAATDDHSGVVGVYDRFDAQGDVVPQWAWVMRYSGGAWRRVYDHGVYLPLLLRSSS